MITDKPRQAIMQHAQDSLLLAAVRTLLVSHPERDQLREAWNYQLSLMYADHALSFADSPELTMECNEAFRLLQPNWDGYVRSE